MNNFKKFSGNKDCTLCHGEGSYMYDDNHGKICEDCCTHPEGFTRLDPEMFGVKEGELVCKTGCGARKMNNSKKNQLPEDVEKRFNKRFPGLANYDDKTDTWGNHDIKAFLAQEIQRAKEEGARKYGEPLSTFIQWKGTDLCMDWFCEDGHQNHWDGDFAYEISCDECGKTYYPESSVSLNKNKPDWMN